MDNSGDYSPEIAKKEEVHQEQGCAKCEQEDRSFSPMATGGPDDSCYMWDDQANYHWISVSNLVGSGDDQYYTVNLPFTFDFYGVGYTQVVVCTNGWVSFANPSSSYTSNECLPSSDPIFPGIAVFWDDLVVDTGIYTGGFGGFFVIEWRGVSHYSYSGNGNFELILYDGGYAGCDSFKIQYANVTIGGYDNGSSATVGMQNEAGGSGDCLGGGGSVYLQYSCNSASLSANQAILFYRDSTCTPSGGGGGGPIPDIILAMSWNPDTFPRTWISYDGGVNWAFRSELSTPGAVGNKTHKMVQNPVSHDVFALVWAQDMKPQCYMSTDTGLTWTLQGTINMDTTGRGEPILSAFCQPDSDLFCVVWDQDRRPECWRSTDLGVSWNRQGIIPDSLGSSSGSEDVVGLTGDVAGNLYALVWFEDNSLTSRNPNIYMSGDEGVNWTFRGVVDPSVNGYEDPAGDIAINVSGDLRAALWWADVDGICDIHTYTSNDGGSTWSFVSNATNEWESSWQNNYVSYAITAAGHHYIGSWIDGSGGAPSGSNFPVILRSLDNGSTWDYINDIAGEQSYGGSDRASISVVEFYSPLYYEIGEGRDMTQSIRMRVNNWILYISSPAFVSNASITLYDITGREVSRIHNGRLMGEESFQLPEVPSGVYWVILRLGNNTLSTKAVRIR